MTLIQRRIVADARAPLARRAPLAKLATAFIPAMVLLVSVDPVSSGVVFAGTAVTVPGWGVSWAGLARRLWPLAIACFALALGNAVFTDRKGGAALVDVGPLLLTTESMATGATSALRVAAIALPGILAVLTIDPVDLADSLVQHLRLPARLAYGSLAALRLAPLTATEWRVLGRSRRARGFGGDRNPVAAARLFAGMMFALLVGAVRRGSQLAVAMDARGFASTGPRTAARRARFDRADAVLVAVSVAVTATAVWLAIMTAAWSPVV